MAVGRSSLELFCSVLHKSDDVMPAFIAIYSKTYDYKILTRDSCGPRRSNPVANMTDNAGGYARTALILYGTETGNSQDVADELGRLLERLHFITRVSELNTIKAVRQPNPSRVHVLDAHVWCIGFPCQLWLDNICCFHHRPGRFPRRRESFLENAALEEASANLFAAC